MRVTLGRISGKVQYTKSLYRANIHTSDLIEANLSRGPLDMVEVEERKLKEREEAVRGQEERDKRSGKFKPNKKKDHDDVRKKDDIEDMVKPKEQRRENKK